MLRPKLNQTIPFHSEVLDLKTSPARLSLLDGLFCAYLVLSFIGTEFWAGATGWYSSCIPRRIVRFITLQQWDTDVSFAVEKMIWMLKSLTILMRKEWTTTYSIPSTVKQSEIPNDISGIFRIWQAPCPAASTTYTTIVNDVSCFTAHLDTKRFKDCQNNYSVVINTMMDLGSSIRLSIYNTNKCRRQTLTSVVIKPFFMLTQHDPFPSLVNYKKW